MLLSMFYVLLISYCTVTYKMYYSVSFKSYWNPWKIILKILVRVYQTDSHYVWLVRGAKGRYYI